MTSLAASWQSAKVVRTREKVSFFLGVMNLVFSSLIFAKAPQYVHFRTFRILVNVLSRWVHVAYTVQGLYLLPLRFFIYKKRAWHYFLFDLCYFVTILNFVFFWLLPSSPALFIACYCLSHGSLASAVITWRNSLVFHDLDKVTSLFIHIYAPFSFTAIRYDFYIVSDFPLSIQGTRHFYPNAEQRFPALLQVPTMNPLKALGISGGICTPGLLEIESILTLAADLIWQLLYWKVGLCSSQNLRIQTLFASVPACRSSGQNSIWGTDNILLLASK